MLEATDEVEDVKKKISEEMGRGDFEAAQDLRNVELFPESQFGSADYFYGHHDASPKKTSTTAVTTTFATAMGKSPFQPRLMSWS